MRPVNGGEDAEHVVDRGVLPVHGDARLLRLHALGFEAMAVDRRRASALARSRDGAASAVARGVAAVFGQLDGGCVGGACAQRRIIGDGVAADLPRIERRRAVTTLTRTSPSFCVTA